MRKDIDIEDMAETFGGHPNINEPHWVIKYSRHLILIEKSVEHLRLI